MPLKLTFNDEIHRFSKLPENFKDLVTTITSAFDSKLPPSWTISYLNSHGNKINLANAYDYEELLKIESSDPSFLIKLFITPVEASKVQNGELLSSQNNREKTAQAVINNKVNIFGQSQAYPQPNDEGYENHLAMRKYLEAESGQMMEELNNLKLDQPMDSQLSLPDIEVHGKSRLRILEGIKSLGYEAQNQTLMQQGFTKLSQNIKYLKLYGGDVQLIISKLGEKVSHKKSKREAKKNDEEEAMVEENPRKVKKAHRISDEFNQPIEKASKLDKKKTKEQRKAREPRKEVHLKDYTEWPSEVNTVYLDGNNMLFVEDSIRKLALKRKKTEAEKVLTELARNFARCVGNCDVILIFDNTRFTFEEKIATSKGVVNFSVVSAAPKFKTSDDALVAWSEGLGENLKKCFFVTSDRGLQVRLEENGVEHISKTKRWFNFAKNFMGETTYNSLL